MAMEAAARLSWWLTDFSVFMIRMDSRSQFLSPTSPQYCSVTVTKPTLLRKHILFPKRNDSWDFTLALWDFGDGVSCVSQACRCWAHSLTLQQDMTEIHWCHWGVKSWRRGQNTHHKCRRSYPSQCLWSPSGSSCPAQTSSSPSYGLTQLCSAHGPENFSWNCTTARTQRRHR